MATRPTAEHHMGAAPLPPAPDGAESPSVAEAPAPGVPGIGIEGSLPPLDPMAADLEPQVVEVDWPPAVQHTPDSPADTPGWQDDQSAAAQHGGRPESDDVGA